ncbi:[protein-PII] uridylyltransferase family protein [Lacunimicrobium album]
MSLSSDNIPVTPADLEDFRLLLTLELQAYQKERVELLLTGVGFQNWEVAHKRFAHLCDHSEESRPLLLSILQMLLHALSEVASPDSSLINFERFVQSVPSRHDLFVLLSQQPRAVEILIKLFVSSQFLTEILLKNSSYLERLTHHRKLAEFKTQQEFLAEALEQASSHPRIEAQLNAIRRYQHWELLRIGACDSFGLMDLKTVTLQLSLLADAIVQACLKLLADDLNVDTTGFIVLAFGKLGGEELNYSSDIDLVFLAKDDAGRFWSLAQKLIKALMEATQDGFMYRVDMRLRPWGRSGALVTTITSHIDYLHKSAVLWEKQAMIKARCIAGDVEAGRDFLMIAHDIIYTNSPPEIRESVRKLKATIEAELARKGRTWGEVKAGVGSIRDVEFVTQALQLMHGRNTPGVRSINTLDALIRLADRSIIQADEYRQLASGYVFLRTIEHSLQLMHYKQVHTLPTEPREQAYLARRLDFPSAEVFLTYYERHTQAIRKIFERYIIGSSSATDEQKPQYFQSFPDRVAVHGLAYEDVFSTKERSFHRELMNRLSPTHLVEVHCELTSDKETPQIWKLTIVGFDTVGVLSATAGLLFELGCNIISGNLFTGAIHDESLSNSGIFQIEHRRPGQTKKPQRDSHRFISVIEVAYDGVPLTSDDWLEYASDLEELVTLLYHGQDNDAHGRLAIRVARAVRSEASKDQTPDRLMPVEINIDVTSSPFATILEIRGDDTPGFLYELGNGLVLSGVRVHRTVIQTAGNQVADTLYVTDILGKKIDDASQLQELRAAITLIKQFTHLLPKSPNPESALLHFRDFLRQLFSQDNWVEAFTSLEQSNVLEAMAQLLGVSDFLWEDFLRIQHANLFPVVANVERIIHPKTRPQLQHELNTDLKPLTTIDQKIDYLNAFKDREMLRIDLRHILGYEQTFGQFSQELTELAEIIVETTTRLTYEELLNRYGQPRLENGSPCRFVVCALGKCGGEELGFASDIELMFLYEDIGETSGREKCTTAEFYQKLVELFQNRIRSRSAGIFEVDLRLRPYGRAGSLAVAREAFQRYFQQGGPAWPYERQALVKLRPIAGDLDFGNEIAELRNEIIFTGEPFDLAAMNAMRERQISQLVKAGTLNAKLSPGGLVDCEYLVQGLQITYGHLSAELRSPNTRESLKALEQVDVITHQDRVDIRDCYRYLRRLIDALRMVRGDARDLTVPAIETDEFAFLARRLGYDDPAQLHLDIEQTMQKVRELRRHLDPLIAPSP